MSPHPFLNRLLPSTLLTLLVAAAVACGGASTDGVSPVAGDPDKSLSILVMARDIEVGQARLPIVVFLSDADRTRVDDRLADLNFYYMHGDDEELTELADISWRQWPVRGGAYTAYAEFDRPGIWELEVRLRDNGEERVGSSFIQVSEESAAPGVGDRAPITVTKTASTVEEVRQISSALNPDPVFYSISLDEALVNGQPTVVLFSTPAFCVTQTCGPQLDMIAELRNQHADKMDFIHVEIFDNIREMLDSGDSSIGRVAQPVLDWGLITEPWTFFVDSDGVIDSRFEQFTTLNELQEAAENVLAQ